MNIPCSSPSYYWFYQGNHRVLVVAVGFGLGPRVAAENLLLDLKITKDGEIQWHDSGLADMAGLSQVRMLLNFGVLSELPECHPEHRIWVDCVDWLRTTLPPHVKYYDLLLREEFFPSLPGGDKGDITKWHSVQPLIRPPKRNAQPDANLILLSFGGVATPYSTDVHAIKMPLAFLRGVRQFLDVFANKRVVAFLPKNLRERCHGSNDVAHEGLELRELDRTAFKEAMKCCKLLICQSGLYTPFEAMKMGLPFALTYPMSFTQAMQLEQFREMGVGCCPSMIQRASQPDGDIEAIEVKWFKDSESEWSNDIGLEQSDRVAAWLATTCLSPLPPPSIETHLVRMPDCAEIVMRFANGS